jgi:hypothetical protein
VAAPTPGAVVDGYELRTILREEGSAVVYLAHHLGLRRDAELRILRPEAVAGDPSARRRFQEAAVRMAALDHPGIVSIYAYGEVGDTAWVASRVPDGPTLADAIASGEVTPRRALAIARQLGEALAAAHRNGVVHRDVRPGAVWCIGPRHVVLGLPGVARSDGATRLGGDALLGDPQFLAPEQLQGVAAEVASDVYALAAVLVACVTGEPPFGPGGSGAVLARRARPSIPQVAIDGVPHAALNAVLREAMEPDPRSRRDGPVEVAQLLAAALASDPDSVMDRPRAFTLTSSRSLEDDVVDGATRVDRQRPSTVSGPAVRAPARAGWKRAAVVIAALAIVVAAGVLGRLSAPGAGDRRVRVGNAAFRYDARWQATPAPARGGVSRLLGAARVLRFADGSRAIAEVGVLRRRGSLMDPLGAAAPSAWRRTVERVGSRSAVVYRDAGTTLIVLSATGGTAVVACSASPLTARQQAACAELAAAARIPGRALRPAPSPAAARGGATAMLSLHNLVVTRQLAFDGGAPAAERARALADVEELYKRAVEDVTAVGVGGPDRAVLDGVAAELRAVVTRYDALRRDPRSAAAQRAAVAAVDGLRRQLAALRGQGYRIGAS